MNCAVPDALGTGYETLIERLKFPDTALVQYGVGAIHPDHFVEHQLGRHQGVVVATAKQYRGALQNPPKTAAELIETLAAQGLPISVDRLYEFH